MTAIGRGNSIYPAILGALLLQCAAAAFSQEPGTVLDEITVTARKSEESLMDVPISVTALDGDTIDRFGLTELQDMAGFVPGLKLGEAALSEVINIRGTGSSPQNAGFENSAGLFIDGTYVSRGAWIRQGQLDLERMEVLRGPQGVYFGKNTIAGAVNLISRDPTDEFEGYVKGSYEFEAADEAAVEGVISGPLVETLKGRLAVRYSDSDGYMKNTVIGDTIPSVEEVIGRLTLVWEPTDNLSVNTKVNYADFEKHGAQIEISECNLADPTSLIATVFAFGIPTREDCRLNRKTAQVILSDAGSAAIPGSSAVPFGDDYDAVSVGTTINWTIGDYQLTSVTGYRSQDFVTTNDIDFLELEFAGFIRDEDFEGWTQEFRINSPREQRLSWTGGVFYETNQRTFAEEAWLNAAVLGAPVPAAGYLKPSAQDTTSWAVFGELRFDVTEQLTLTVGGRYVDEEKDIHHRVCLGLAFNYTCDTVADDLFVPPALAVPLDLRDRLEEDDFSPAVSVTWRPTDDSMFYASYSEGFKAGGFDFELRTTPPGGDDADGDGIPDSLKYDSETVRAYEIGTKLTLLEGAVRFNATVFRNEFDNLQVSIFDGILAFRVGNAAQSTATGAEFEAAWRATDHLTVGSAVSVLNSEYNEFIGGCPYGRVPDAPNGNCDLGGEDRDYAPALAFDLYGDYSQPVFESLLLSVFADVSWSDEYFLDQDADPNNMQDSYWKVNASIGLGSASGTWQVRLIGRNLSDSRTASFGTDVPLSGGSYFKYLDPPRSIAVEARVSF
ncbi:MAG: hypothetical protein A3H91_05370 [Gammaproteobacteria bacterium RIFCSPLOWO2_02_FULL_61_13]|nr:MAG: hypothetical protein A3H91_05370 [Gammaproteobacteria bacterium RIFCSPLOWO2_02_FULL_61_13]